ncbi:hydroxylysine kinase [Esox lucius]|uniref:Hydroxylysine kinase n=1 Tax=Esox lucius TaxID=8010 RepID=A0AAY5JYR2_ESOLU|nr:hydroxylysine kinase [Esox lucius]XP_010894280.2 hydroxylysine kinase [Esox lucius]XP_019904329.2 hydroxylysine kinase [Esox lucius]
MSAANSKPNLSHAQVSELVKRLFGLTPSQISPLPSYDDQNFCVSVSEGGQYVLKVLNSTDSQNTVVAELQTLAMALLLQRGLPSQTALPTVSGQLISQEDIDCGFGRQKYVVRLLTYLPGTPIAKVPCSPQILYEVGKMAAKMDLVLQEMKHPQLHLLNRGTFIWNLSNLPLLESYLPVMDGDPVQPIVKAVIQQYQARVLPRLSCFRKCLNHGDFNDHNILVQPDDSAGYRISGILDFADMSSGYYVYELAIAIMYMMIENPTPLDVGGVVLAGWETVIPLNQAERDSLYLLVLSRFCQSLVVARHTVVQHPENKEYLMITAKTGIRHLCQLWELGKEEVERIWFEGAARYVPGGDPVALPEPKVVQ